MGGEQEQEAGAGGGAGAGPGIGQIRPIFPIRPIAMNLGYGVRKNDFLTTITAAVHNRSSEAPGPRQPRL
jgi:hypothetical protein